MQIGIIGAGGATCGIHLPGFQLCADAEVAVVCDADRDAAEGQEGARLIRDDLDPADAQAFVKVHRLFKIGRASCRERV